MDSFTSELEWTLVWAKSGSADGTDRWHPLLYHMLDVANVARLLWDECIGPQVKRETAGDLVSESSDPSGFLAWLVGLHDLGKACPPFQSRRPDLRARLEKAGLHFGRRLGTHLHGEITALEIRRLLCDGTVPARCSPLAAVLLGKIAGGHHGVFPASDNLRAIGSDSLGGCEWNHLRSQLANQLWNLVLGQEAREVCVSDAGLQNPACVPVLAGLISVADWIGSIEDFFPPSSDTPLHEYEQLSKSHAKKALMETGWLPMPSFAEPKDFAQIFEFAPNALQEVVSTLAGTVAGPYLMVVESPMGSGKTEASLYAADLSLAKAVSRGFYIALPTQATSDAMYRRVSKDYLEKRRYVGNPNLQLIHSNALLADIVNVSNIGDACSEENATLTARSWFAARKRPLLAPFGVGTIDQSLMSVLQTRHWFVRLFGLAGKVAVFDEVHAYDTYMSTIIEHLIRWLAAMDCTIILLSATLPRAKLESLLKAYAGRSWSLPDDVPVYPRVTIASKDRSPACHPIGILSRTKAYDLQFSPPEPDQVVKMVTDRLEDGGCAAIVCNTVDRAQDIYARVHNSLDDCDCTLLHARMPFGWRKERESETLIKFGKPNSKDGKSPHRPLRAIVVATQVVEQSLDLDFDWMVTDMAPIDLLLQRLGRVWRHERKDPRMSGSPMLSVLCDGTADSGPPTFPYSGVYDRYVLLRSWLAIRDRSKIAIPDEVDSLVQQVYSDEEPTDLDELWAGALKEAGQKMLDEKRNDEQTARSILVPEPMAPKDILSAFNLELEDDDDPSSHPKIRAATRLGDPSVQVVCLQAKGDRLVTAVGEVEVDLGVEPSKEQTMALLQSSLPITSKKLYTVLCQMKVPVGWQRSPHLRYHRAIEFHKGIAPLGDWVLRLYPEMGLVIEGKEDNL